jgi:hypothetical protein
MFFKKSLKELEIRYSDLEIDSKVGVGPNGPVYRYVKASVSSTVEQLGNKLTRLSGSSEVVGMETLWCI